MTGTEGPDLRVLAQDAALATVDAVAGALDLASQAASSLTARMSGAVRAVTATATASAASATNAVLDATVPVIATAVVDRIDLKAIVDRALDELDLTQVVLDRVDIDAIIAKADFDPVIDRLPITDIAEYVIEEIDLPAIIRSSTGGIALDAIAAGRIRAMAADELLGRVSDAILLKRRRDTASPLADELQAEALAQPIPDQPSPRPAT